MESTTMLDFLNSTLGVVASVLTIAGLVTGTSYLVKKLRQKVSDKGIANANEGDAVSISGEGVKAGDDSLNVVGNNNKIYQFKSETPSGADPSSEVVNLKTISQILFIDDEPLQMLIRTLRKSGWKNIKRIDDTANLDLPEIRNADIIFVDIKGVGKILQFRNEGVGLAAELKRRYPKKGVVIYSATSEHNLFDPDIDKVDGRLYKNAEPIQFSNMIEQYGRPKN